MELDWTTFGLQVVNFLVLAWLLKRLLYRPVMDVIAQRQAAIRQAMEEARQTQAAAEQLRHDLLQQLAEYARQKSDAMQRVAEETAAERQRRLARLEEELKAQRQRAEAQGQARWQDMVDQAQDAAQRASLAALTRLLERLSGPAVDARLVDMLLEDLAALPEAQAAPLRLAARAPDAHLEIVSARALAPADLQRLRAALDRLTGTPLPALERTDPSLHSGVRIGLGPWLLAASLADELAYFRAGPQRGQ
jgi:F-type H+-transporting ATPase subunit b